MLHPIPSVSLAAKCKRNVAGTSDPMTAAELLIQGLHSARSTLDRDAVGSGLAPECRAAADWCWGEPWGQHIARPAEEPHCDGNRGTVVPKAGFNLGDLKHVYEKQEK